MTLIYALGSLALSAGAPLQVAPIGNISNDSVVGKVMVIVTVTVTVACFGYVVLWCSYVAFAKGRKKKKEKKK